MKRFINVLIGAAILIELFVLASICARRSDQLIQERQAIKNHHAVEVIP